MIGKTIFIIWLASTWMIANVGSKREIGFWPSFFASLLLSPFIGLIIVVLSNKKKDAFFRFKNSMELAKMSEFKGNIEQSIEHYLNAQYYLENDFKYVTESKTMKVKRLESIDNLSIKIAKLKAKLSTTK